MKILGSIISLIGASMWNPAFRTDRYDDYFKLKWSEKIGYHIMVTGLRIMGFKTFDEYEFNKYLNN